MEIPANGFGGMEPNMEKTFIAAAVVVLLVHAAPASADMRGEVVCGVPADEAVVLTWQVTNGSWRIATPAGGRLATFSTEADALGNWEQSATVVCDVTVLVNFREFTGRFYRLNRKMQQYEETPDGVYAGEEDPRRLIIGLSDRSIVPDAARSPGSGSRGAVGGDAPRRPGEVFRDCDGCPEMVVLPGGGLALGRYEVTVGEYRAFASATGGGTRSVCVRLDGDTTSWRNPGYAQTDRQPVTCVSWDDVQEYVSWLSRTAGATYRLPTEAEWESAAAGSQRGCDRERTGNIGTCPVGSYGSNAAGLSDMVGNLWEWTEDCWEGDCGFRVIRGGVWNSSAEVQRPGARSWYSATGQGLYVGFRVARTLD